MRRRRRGIAKAGNRLARAVMFQVARMWIKHQPESEPTNRMCGAHSLFASRRIGSVGLRKGVKWGLSAEGWRLTTNERSLN